MNPMASILIFSLLSLLSVARAQGRAPHGLTYESPMAFSPSAYDFFHPNTRDPCASSNCSPLPMAATVASTLGHQSKPTMSEGGGNHVGAGVIGGIVFGFVCVVILALGVYYVMVTRQVNISRTKPVQPDA